MFNMPELALVEVLVLRYDNVQHARTLALAELLVLRYDNVQHARTSFSRGASLEI